MRAADAARLTLLGAIWGASFFFMRVLAPELGAILTAGLRLFVAGLFLSGLNLLLRKDVGWRKYWRHLILVGAVNSALPFSLFAYAASHIPAGYSAILNATSPLFGTVFSALWLGERMKLSTILGLLLGGAGVVLVSAAPVAGVDHAFFLSICACLVAAACYGLAGVYIKKFASQVPPISFACGSQLAAGLMLLPLTLLFPVHPHASLFLGANILCLALLCSALAYTLYYRLIRDLGPAKALTVTFLIPVFGILWAALFLHEPISLAMILGIALVLGGTAVLGRG